MTSHPGPGWVVLKFGGTSVSSRPNWQNILRIARERRESGARVLVVHSAVSGITDRLERTVQAALAGDASAVLTEIRERHVKLSQELGIPLGSQVEAWLDELQQMATSVALMREASDRLRARVMAFGELLATDLGARFLASQGLPAAWADARTLLRAERRESATEKAGFLSATCDFSPDHDLSQRLAALGPVVVTQGFIASDDDGNTVLLGRGGSDTSAAYLAAKLQAQRLEIWTDVPGMFSANPRTTPSARQLLALTYDEAQEIATAGAKVLHPRCILPARQQGVPLYVFATQAPELGGTLLTDRPGNEAAQVKAVCIKKGITLVSMESPGMWHAVGFLADAFQVFKQHGLSIDLVSTSETNVTVSLDPQANTLDAAMVDRLLEDLNRLCRAEVIGPCASVSLVGRNIRSILHRLGDALALFEEQRIYLVSQAANDLNFTFVVDESQGDRLVEELHEMLVAPVRADEVLGPTWEQLMAGRGGAACAARAAPEGGAGWWRGRRAELERLMAERDCAYVYDGATITARARALRGLKSVARVFYAMKANWHPEVLRRIAAEGLGIECVSRGEIEHARAALPGLTAERLLFTPNFAPRAEYDWAFAQGLTVTVDNLEILRDWGASLRGRALALRVDPGVGRGHHAHVRTGGSQSKFGIPVDDLDEAALLVREAGASVVGLHAHVGSGVFRVASWAETGRALAETAHLFGASLRWINVGGGLGVPDREGKPELDLGALDAALAEVRRPLAGLELWLEPGRYLVADAGVLLARVTQTKRKRGVCYIGLATGMNSLIRPALYGAHHDIFNLSRAGEAATELCNVVGPICETGDFLGYERWLPPTRTGDVLLISTAGAYGAVMSSRYNLREPAGELLI